MKILFLTPQLPYPPNKGTAIRNFNIIKNLAARHELWLLSFADDAFWGKNGKAGNGGLENLRVLNQLCRYVDTVPMPRRDRGQRLATALFSPAPDLVLRLSSEDFEDKLTQLLSAERFDIVQIEGLEMARLWSNAWSRTRLKERPWLVLDEHNAEYVLQRRAFQIDLGRPARWVGAIYSFLQWAKLRRYERRMCSRMDVVVTVSERDRQQLLKLNPNLHVEVVANGVDVGYFDDLDFGDAALGEASLVFTGTMDFRPNVDGVTWFAQAVWPRILRAVPDARFYVVGRNPKPEVLGLERIPGIVVTGAVRDIRPFFKGAVLSIVPVRMGGGSRLKILEAMAARVPILSTTMGAEGIDITPGVDIAIADEPEDFAREAVSLLHDPEKRAALAARGRELVATRYDWPAVVPALDALYQRLGEATSVGTPLATNRG